MFDNRYIVGRVHAIPCPKQVEEKEKKLQQLLILRKNDNYNGVLKDALQQRQLIILQKIVLTFLSTLQGTRRKSDNMVELMTYFNYLKETKRTWTKKDSEELRRLMGCAAFDSQDQEPSSSSGKRFLQLASAIAAFTASNESALLQLACNFTIACRQKAADLEDRILLSNHLLERAGAADMYNVCKAQIGKYPLFGEELTTVMQKYKAGSEMCNRYWKIMHAAYAIYKFFAKDKDTSAARKALKEDVATQYHTIDTILQSEDMAGNRIVEHIAGFRNTFSIKSVAQPEFETTFKDLKACVCLFYSDTICPVAFAILQIQCQS
jgi:hypothetical protein